MMNRLPKLAIAVLLAAWTWISFLMSGAIYAVIGSILGRGFSRLEPSLGRLTVDVTKGGGIDVPWFIVLVTFLILVALNVPLVWFMTRKKKTGDPEQRQAG